jgi:hypothetical protein
VSVALPKSSGNFYVEAQQAPLVGAYQGGIFLSSMFLRFRTHLFDKSVSSDHPSRDLRLTLLFCDHVCVFALTGAISLLLNISPLFLKLPFPPSQMGAFSFQIIFGKVTHTES